jgi:hypothetical protein
MRCKMKAIQNSVAPLHATNKWQGQQILSLPCMRRTNGRGKNYRKPRFAAGFAFRRGGNMKGFTYLYPESVKSELIVDNCA